MTERRHFHTFDALRFIAFSLVFLLHAPLPNNQFFNFISKSGGIGVTFFFVLSGFLITYILLYEKELHGKINLKKFFIRRILRIWPLYYLMILFAFLTPYILDNMNLSYSNEGYTPNWLISCLFLENYNMMFTGDFPNTSPLRVMWSLCIEEHFYIVWGLILYYAPIKKVPMIITLSIIVATISRLIYPVFSLNDIDLFTHIDYFAFGSIPAYCLIKKKHLIEIINSIPIYQKLVLTCISLCYVFIAPNISFSLQNIINPIIFSILFTLIIFFIIPLKNSLLIKDSNVFSKLGTYTYGLYLYHTIAINLMVQLYMKIGLDIDSISLSITSIIITIFISLFSYKLFELKFIKLKKYFY